MEWTGWKPGDTLINLWGSERDILEGKKGLKSIVKENLMNTYLLNSFNMSEDNMRKYVKFINKKSQKLSILMCSLFMNLQDLLKIII